MRRLCGTASESTNSAWRPWLSRVVVVMLLGGNHLPNSLLYSQAPMPSEGQTPTQEAPPAAQQPPARPLSATERVLKLTLEDAIRLALQHNLDIERERFSPQIERTEVEKARADFDPVIGVEAEISQNKILPTTEFVEAGGEFVAIKPFRKEGEITPLLKQKIVTGGNYEIRFRNTRENISPTQSGGVQRTIQDPRYESGLELTFTQPLLKDFGISVNKATIRQAQKSTEIAEQQVLQTILDTVFEVQESYWDLVFRIQDLEAKRESQKLAEDFLEENKVRVELGTLAPIELVQAETRVKTREGDVIVAEEAVGNAEDRVKNVLNIPETMGTWNIRIHLIDSPSFVPASTIVLEDKVTQALKSRPDFLQSQLRIDSLEIDREVARNQRLPQLDFQTQGRLEAFDGDFPGSAGNLDGAEGYFWSFGLKFEYPLGNRFARNELQKRNLELKQALVDQRNLKRTIVRQLRQAIRDIDTTIKRVEVTQAATVLAQTQLEAEQEKFRLGLSTSFVVLDFQEDLTIARSDETRALSDYNIAIARLDQLTGTLRYGDITAGRK
jgi:outer membrane protein TolC